MISEEAAGITKFKAQKKGIRCASWRYTEQQNLVRVADLIRRE